MNSQRSKTIRYRTYAPFLKNAPALEEPTAGFGPLGKFQIKQFLLELAPDI